MHFSIMETLSFNLMYDAAGYPVGTTISKTSYLFTTWLQHYNLTKIGRGLLGDATNQYEDSDHYGYIKANLLRFYACIIKKGKKTKVRNS